MVKIPESVLKLHERFHGFATCRVVAPDVRLPDDYHRLYGIWFACGFPAFAPVPAIIWLMSTRAGNRILIGGNDRKVYTSSTSTTPVTERTAEAMRGET